MLHLGGRIGDGVVAGTGLLPEVIKDTVARVHAGAREAGRAPSDVEIWFTARSSLHDDRATAIEQVKASVSSILNHSMRFGLDGKNVPDDLRGKIQAYLDNYVLYDHVLQEGQNPKRMEALGSHAVRARSLRARGQRERLDRPHRAGGGGGRHPALGRRERTRLRRTGEVPAHPGRTDHEEVHVKILFFDDWKLGVLNGDNVVDVSDAVKDIPRVGPGDVINGLIARFGDYKAQIAGGARARAPGVPVAKVRVRPPLPKPDDHRGDGRELHGGRHAHGAGADQRLPQVAERDHRPRRHHGAAGRARPRSSRARRRWRVIIGKRATRVSQADAMSYVFGYCNFIDGSARGLPPSGNTFYQMKSRDTFCPIGPYLVTADEIADPHKRQIKLWVNGELKQNFNTDDMAHKIPRCIEWVTSIHTLEPGDIVATGTNHRGLSGFQDGDRIELETEGLGRLTFGVRDELKRTWGRETRLDRQNKGLEGTTPQVSGKHAPKQA